MSLRTTRTEHNGLELLESIEQVLSEFGWTYERDGNDGVQSVAQTRWGEMGCIFAVRPEPAAMHFSLTMDVKPQTAKRAAISELIILMNERLWLGHLDFWIEDEVIIFRHTIPLAGRVAPSYGEIKSVLSAALEATERFIPAINFVIWAGKPPREAMTAALFETEGEA